MTRGHVYGYWTILLGFLRTSLQAWSHFISIPGYYSGQMASSR